MNKLEGSITMACYRLQIDPENLTPADQFPGWPKKIHFTDNYARQAAAHLPVLQVKGMTNPVVQVTNERSGEIEYTIRVQGTTFRPKIFDADATYSVSVGQPDTGTNKTVKGVVPLTDNNAGSLKFTF